MRLGVSQFLTVSRLTALEAVRQPIFMLLATTSVLLVGLFPVLITHTLSEGARLIRDCALALQFVTGLVLGSLCACHALSRDIRRGTAATILTKPVGRVTFFLAKYSGVASALLAYMAVMTAAALLSVRTVSRDDYQFDWWGSGPLLAAVPLALIAAGLQNFFSRCAFTSRAFAWLAGLVGVALLASALVPREAGGGFGVNLPWTLVPAGALIALAVLVLAALATALATRLEIIPVLSLCSGVFLFGLISDYLVGQLSPARRATVGRLIDLLPNWQHFWLVDALNRDGIPLPYLLHAAAYAGFCLAGLLAAGIFAFHRMEVR